MEPNFEEFTRIVVAVDPAVTSGEDADDTGIIVVARGPHQSETCELQHCPGHGYVLDDQTCHLPPAEWAKHVVSVYEHWKADRIVAETNNGGDMIGTLVQAVRAGVPYAKVTATRGKQLRAEPISALYDQGRVHHLSDFPELRLEQETWTPDAKWSPNRLDALVWGLTYLGLVGGQGAAFMTMMQEEIAKQGWPTPPEFRQMPKLDHEVIRQYAKEKCKDGGHHRFMEYADGGEFQCAKCGGWLNENE